MMSSHAGATGVNGSRRIGTCGTEDTGKGNTNHETYTPCSKAVSPRLGSANPAGEGRSSDVGQLVKPALPGRKAHKKTCDRGRQMEEIQERDKERPNIEGSNRGKQRRISIEITETCEDVAQNRQKEGKSKSLSSCNSDIQLNKGLEVGEGSNLSRRHLCPRSGCSKTNVTSLNPQSPQPATRSVSSASPQPPFQTRPSPLSSQRPLSGAAAEDSSSFDPSREPDPFWGNVRTEPAARPLSQSHHPLTHILALASSELRDEEEDEDEEDDHDMEDSEEEGSGILEVMSQTVTLALVPPCPFGERRMSKREKNRLKCLRRRQRRRERWRQSQQDRRQSSTGNPSSGSSSSEDEEEPSARDRDGYVCAVCLDVYFSPYMCHPCSHIFCEPCLRTLAKNSPTNTPCPLCRTVITHVFFQKELNQTARTFFPKEYLCRKQNFQKATCAKWPLPSCRKLFRIFSGFQRQSSPIARRQFPHGGGYRMDAMEFEDPSRGWRFDLDMIIIYIYSVNWIIGFLIFCFLCYLYFPSF